MQCPLCGGDFDGVTIKTDYGDTVNCNQCDQCGSFWFDSMPEEPLTISSVAQYDTPQPNFSMEASDSFCPVDQTLLANDELEDAPAWLKTWRCPSCGGVFFPKGQLALYAKWQKSQDKTSPLTQSTITRPKATIAVALTAALFTLVLGSVNRLDLFYSASTGSPLPSTGPNIAALILLAAAYIAGTIIAVLGRKLPLIIIGWSVIIACIFGFAIIIFGP